MKNIEILAPVGSPQVLEAAVYSGADAVYLGTSKYSARESAGNFSDEELIDAVSFCHARGVKVFVAINTLFKDNEIQNVMKTVEFLCKISVDAVIVQDMGLLYLIRKCCPGLTVHCSTQMVISSKSATKLAESLGVKRVVLAREMSLDEIKNVKENTDVELEVFVHGALCMCVSGQCYFSAMLGSRSGNRGRCAQTCRLPFFTDEIENALSLKDLGYIDDINKLADAGVASAKIEGRMKRPEYVAAAVSSARGVIDNGYADFEVKENLEAVFSRSGFTKGYLEGKIDRDMFGIRTKSDVEKGNSDVFAKLHGLYRTELQKIALDIKITILKGQKPTINATDCDGNCVEIMGDNEVEKARNRPLSKEDIVDRISKLGGTTYFAKNVDVITDEISILPMSVMNGLRRKMTDEMTILRTKRDAISYENNIEKIENRESTSMKLRAEFRSFEQIPNDVSMLEYVYLPLSASVDDFTKLKSKNVKIGAVMPNVIFSCDEKVKEKAKKLMEIGVKTFVCGNLYAVQIAREIGAVIHGKYSLNILNSYALKQFEDLGMTSAEVSFEIKDVELANIKSKIERGIMVYGRQTLMLTRNCPVKTNDKTCAKCKSTQILHDRKGIDFPVICNKFEGEKFDFHAQILNSTVLTLQDRLHEVKNVDFVVLRFTVENNVEINQVLSAFIRQEKPDNDYTRGLFYRGVL